MKLFYPHYSNIPRLFWGSYKPTARHLGWPCCSQPWWRHGCWVQRGWRNVEIGNPLIRFIDVSNSHWLVAKKRWVWRFTPWTTGFYQWRTSKNVLNAACVSCFIREGIALARKTKKNKKMFSNSKSNKLAQRSLIVEHFSIFGNQSITKPFWPIFVWTSSHLKPSLWRQAENLSEGCGFDDVTDLLYVPWLGWRSCDNGCGGSMGRNPASCCWFWNNVDVYNWVNLGYIRTIVLLKSFAINGIFLS